MKNRKNQTEDLDLSLRVRYSRLCESQNLWDFSKNLIQSSRVFVIWDRYKKYFHRFRFISTLIRITPWVLLAISTNTWLYLVFAALAISIPLLLLALLSLLGSALVRHRRVNRIMWDKLAGRTVYVLFPERNAEFLTGKFWQANARDLATGQNAAVILVSPFFLSPVGLSRRDFFLNVRDEAPNIFIVRRHYFFSLKKHVLTRCAGRLILIF